jgi:ligand-binding sensor domain-containing protein/signal transduction histidine kinase
MFCRPFQFGLKLAVLVATWTTSAAPIAERVGSEFSRVNRWTTDDGLPQHRIACIKQDHDGYVWLGTWNGLVRFDGLEFTVFNKFNTRELTNDAIAALALDTSGTLWIGTVGGLVSYREHKFEQVRTSDGLMNRNIQRLAASRTGGTWFHAGAVVGLFRDGTHTPTVELNTPGNSPVATMEEGPDGWLNVFTEKYWLGISTTGEVRTNYATSSNSGGLRTGRLASAPGVCWLGGGDGVHRTQFGGGQALVPIDDREPRPMPPDAENINVVYQDRDGFLWVNAQPGGLKRWNGKEWEPLDLGQGATVCVEEDMEGNLWLGNDLGLAELHRRSFRSYTMSEGLLNNNVLSVCEDRNGAIWIGSNHGLTAIENGNVDHDFDVNSRDFEVRGVWPLPDGGVWLARPGYGLFAFHDRHSEPRIFQAGLPGLPNALYGDSQGQLWVGTDRGALTLGAEPPNSPGTPIAEAELQDVRSFLKDKEGSLWVGTKGQGLARVHDGKASFLTEQDGLSNNKVWSLHQDDQGTLWIGTDNGLTRYRNGKMFPCFRRHGLLENTINCVLEDECGHLWLSGLRGIYRVPVAQLNAVADGRADSFQCMAFGTADGMPNAETNGGENQPAGWKARDGRFWFPTLKGVVVIDPATVPPNENPAPVVIEQVKADENLVLGEEAVENPRRTSSNPETEAQSSGSKPLRRPDNYGRPRDNQLFANNIHVVEFKYNANSFVAPERVRFKYRLKGADPNWREETSQRTARYYNLPPGDYTFEVLAANHHNVWSTVPAVFPFSLAPHLWQTWPFYVLSAATVAALAGAILGYRLRWQHRLSRLEQQRALATERARIARDLHDDLGTALTGLALELDVVGREAGATPLTTRLAETAQRTRQMAERMREVVWTVNPSCDTLSSLASFLEQQVSQFLRLDSLRVHLDFPEDLPERPIGAEGRHQLALAVREALTNVVRHAKATEVWVSLSLVDATSPSPNSSTARATQALVVQIKDNGSGLQAQEKGGHGLANMRERLEAVGGTFSYTAAPGMGTTITLCLALTGLHSQP